MEVFDIKQTWERIPDKVNRMIAQIKDGCPNIAGPDGIYDNVRADQWTSGFWPALVWLLYDMTGEKAYRNTVWNWDSKIEQWLISENVFCHDVGFQFLGPAVFKHRLTGDEDAKRIGLQAANFLASRFNLAGRFLRAWIWKGDEGDGIIDCLMNLPLLYWASEVSGDPRYKQIATAHAETALQFFIRPDGSSRHIVRFDPESGEFMESRGGQGAGSDSAWSRGQAWALYGMCNIYKYTGETKYLNTAKQVAHYFLAALPKDGIPYWDFRLVDTRNEPKDTSAAAIAASGLMEIADQVPACESGLYRNAAHELLRNLTEQYGTCDQPEHQAILTGATANKPSGIGIDVSVIYGDYFYVEALAKCMGWSHRMY